MQSKIANFSHPIVLLPLELGIGAWDQKLE